MSDIPSGKNTHVPQADGAPASSTTPPPPASAAGGESHRYAASISWVGDATGCGDAYVAKEKFAIPIGGGKELGGCGKGANSEELLLAAVGTCWVGTWAIFLKKLGIPYPDPKIRLTGELGKDPAGGFRMTGMKVFARVPSALLASHRPAIEKTVGLAERYCIISKVAKASMPVEAEIEEIL